MNEAMEIEEFAAEMKGCAADIETAKDCLKVLCNIWRYRTPRQKRKEAANVCFGLPLLLKDCKRSAGNKENRIVK